MTRTSKDNTGSYGPAYEDLKEISDWLAAGDIAQLELAAQLVDSFPHGVDDFFGGAWIVHAVDAGNLTSVNWMIAQGVALNSDGGAGFPPLHTCIDAPHGAKYAILAALIAAGADINARGINGWTPLHLAAIRDDQTAMDMLLKAGADRTITTGIDDNATAEEEARILGHHHSADFIARFVPD